MARKPSARLRKVSVSLPFRIGSLEWEIDPAERRAAWSLYVELCTRISTQPLDMDQGLLREALTSLHGLFATTREILKQGGPDVGASAKSVGGIAMAVLNRGLRPFLSKWHPQLQAWEAGRPAQAAPAAHERSWEHEPALRGELEALRRNLQSYAKALAAIAGVDP